MHRSWRACVVYLVVAVLPSLTACNRGPQVGKSVAAERLSNVAEFDQPPKVGLGQASAQAPMSLTCSDGSGLELRGLQARAVVDGPLAFTQLHLVFHNPEPRQREGRFSITLPPGAVVSRFAMQVEDRWMEGEMVEKQKARRIYEDYLHRRQDPAILEQDAGNVFEARVFPIPASGDKNLVLAWSQELVDPAAPYALPLLGLPKMRDLQVAVHVRAQDGQSTPIQVVKQDFQPPVDLVVRRAALGHGDEVSRAGGLAVARVQVPAETKELGFGRVVVLFDTSASEALGFEQRIERLRQVLAFAADKGATDAAVVLFDQVTETAYQGPPRGFDDLAAAKVQARGALGASDLGLALDAVAKVAQAGQGPTRVVLMTNALPTAGGTDAKVLAGKVKALGLAGVQRLDVVTQSSARDEALARTLVTAGLQHAGTVVAIGSGKADLSALGRMTLGRIEVRVAGAEWVFPEHVEGLQAGESVLVYAALPADKPFALSLSGATQATPTLGQRDIEEALLQRAAVGAKIRRLEAQLDGAPAELASVLKDQIVDLSVNNRVLSRYTALLVLESDGEYARYKIDQKALANILFVTADGRAVLADRTAAYGLVEIAKRPQAEQPAENQAKQGAAHEVLVEEKQAGLDEPAPAGRRANLDRDLERGPPAEAPAAAKGAGTGEDAKRQARSAVAKNTIAGAFEAGSATKLFGDAAEGEDGSVVAKAFGGSDDKPRAAKTGGFGERARARPHGADEKKEEATVRVRLSSTAFEGDGEATSDVARVVARKNSALQRCYEMALRDDPSARGRFRVRFVVGTAGTITDVQVTGATGGLADCIQAKFMSIRGLPLLPSPRTFTNAYVFDKDRFEPHDRPGGQPSGEPAYTPPPPTKRPHVERAKAAWVSAPNTPEAPGVRYERLSEGLRAGAAQAVLAEARAWRKEAPTELLALVALGRALAANGEVAQAARALGSILDLYPSRADLRRYAGNLLESLGDAGAGLALDTYQVAKADRPDHPSVYHAATMALARTDRLLEAIDIAVEGLQAPKRNGNFWGSERILQDDVRQLVAAWLAKNPTRIKEVLDHAKQYAPTGLDQPGVDAAAVARSQALIGIRFILTWETDANDVDFHVIDAYGEEGYYSNRSLRSGGELYADITTGYGPESFAIPNPCGFPYRLWAHYYSMGPMGFGMGRVQAIRFDGARFTFDERPFAITRDGANVELGMYEGLPSDPAVCPQFAAVATTGIRRVR